MGNDIEYILDACTIVHFLRGKPPVVEKIMNIDRNKTYITPITIAEAYFGMINVPKSGYEDMRKMIDEFGVIPINSIVAMKHAELKCAAKITGCEYDMDLWMVAFCEITGAKLLTTDAKLRNRLKHVANNIEVIEIK